MLENLKLGLLRVINLSGNEITVVENVAHLPSLVELNVKKNRVSS
jgi:Leucine-rich repeat (LRR) protein